MPFLTMMALAMAIGWWWGGRKRREAARRKTTDELDSAYETGLPVPSSAVGQKAREVADAQARQLAEPPSVHGSARWATSADAKAILDANHRQLMAGGTRKLWLGSLEEGGVPIPVVASYPGHLLTVAGTGQGKSATQIIANLLTYKGSAVVMDPKGELYRTTAAKRRKFGRVYRLAPLARSGEPASDRYNPLLELDDPNEPGRERGSRARRLAEMLMVRQGQKGAAEATFFENEAINLLTAIILYIAELAERAKVTPTLDEVRYTCTLPMLGARKEREADVHYLEDTLIAMATKSSQEFVRRQGNAFRGLESKLLGSFLSEINSNLAFWDGHQGFAETTAESDFRFSDLERETITVYLTIPFKDMPTSYRFLRAMIGMAFAALEEKADATQASVLFVLDEFAALKDMEFMRDAVAQMRSSGAWFWFFVQDLAQLEGVYGRWSAVFLSQTDHQVYFGGTLDAKTTKHISNALGVTTFPYRDANVTWSHSIGMSDGESAQPTAIGGVNFGRNVGQSVNIAEPVILAPRPLLNPFEVGTFLSACEPGDRYPSSAIILSKQAGGYPVKARRQHWETVTELKVTAPIALTRPTDRHARTGT